MKFHFINLKMEDITIYLNDIKNNQYFKIIIEDLNPLYNFVIDLYLSRIDSDLDEFVGLIVYFCFTDNENNIVNDNMSEINEDEIDFEEYNIIKSAPYGFKRDFADLLEELWTGYSDDYNDEIQLIENKLKKYRK